MRQRSVEKIVFAEYDAYSNYCIQLLLLTFNLRLFNETAFAAKRCKMSIENDSAIDILIQGS